MYPFHKPYNRSRRLHAPAALPNADLDRAGCGSLTVCTCSKLRIKKAKKAVGEDKGEYVMQADLNEIFVGPEFDFTVREACVWVGVAHIVLAPTPCSGLPLSSMIWRSREAEEIPSTQSIQSEHSLSGPRDGVTGSSVLSWDNFSCSCNRRGQVLNHMSCFPWPRRHWCAMAMHPAGATRNYVHGDKRILLRRHAGHTYHTTMKNNKHLTPSPTRHISCPFPSCSEDAIFVPLDSTFRWDGILWRNVCHQRLVLRVLHDHLLG